MNRRSTIGFLLTALTASACGSNVGVGSTDVTDSSTHDADASDVIDAPPPCPDGYHRCATGCVSDHDPMTCGASCSPCTVPEHATATCDGVCGFDCDLHYALSNGRCVQLGIPRAVSPLSGARATSRRPTFEWALADGEDGAEVEICRDPACATLVTRMDGTGTTAAPRDDLPVGVLFWRLRGRLGSTVSGGASRVWELRIGPHAAPVDTSWGAAWDANRDGYADVLIGGRAGVLQGIGVYFGQENRNAVGPVRVLEAPRGTQAQWADVQCVGDVNGDGYLDFGASYVQGVIESAPGVVLVYHGGPFGPMDPPATTIPVPYSNIAFAGAGDVNRDGYGDMILGYYLNTSPPGSAFVFYGSATGLSATPSAELAPPADVVTCFGTAVAGVGDVNGDRFADVAVTAVRDNFSRLYVYAGGATGLAPDPLISIWPPSSDPINAFGSVVSGDDFNGDGYADVATVLLGDMITQRTQGILYFGARSGTSGAPVAFDIPYEFTWAATMSAGDINGDGFADLLAASRTSGASLHFGAPQGLGGAIALEIVGTFGFGSVVLPLGDVDGDGFDDILEQADRTTTTRWAHVMFGSDRGLENGLVLP